jgi:hypothetical protein
MTDDAPNYDITIDADDLLAELAADAAAYGGDYKEKRQWWADSLETPEPFYAAEQWMLQASGGRRAYSEAIAALQPEAHSVPVDCYRNDDGTVDVRGYMRWLSECADAAHDRGGVPGTNPQANEAETAYSRILSTLRDDYGVGWPRLDDLGGNPLECDLP